MAKIIDPATLELTERTVATNRVSKTVKGGLHPLCGTGVTSRISVTSRPTVERALIADSLP